MKNISEVLFPVTEIITGVTGICQIDGEFTVLDYQPPFVVIQFARTGNMAMFAESDVVHDEGKRKKTKDPLYWYSVAVGLEGFVYPNGRYIVDVRSANRVVLDNGDTVRLDYKGIDPVIKDRSAYGKWHLIKAQEPDKLCPEWLDFQVFQDWFMKHKPTTKRKWSLRSLDGTWSPTTCGFDDRTDLPVSSATLIDSVLTRL